jgi:two-component system, NarL family, sensor kinase
LIFHFGRLPDDVEIAIFRIVQECLTNIHRHSGSATATIAVYRENDFLTVQVRDEGKGIPKDKQRDLLESGRAGIGFGGMRERLRQLGGSLEIQSEGRGTTVIAKVRIA